MFRRSIAVTEPVPGEDLTTATAHLVVGFYYLAGGLVIPGYVLYPLWAVWIGLAWWLVTLARRYSWWTPLPPVVAAVLFLVVITVGEQVLGWRG